MQLPCNHTTEPDSLDPFQIFVDHPPEKFLDHPSQNFLDHPTKNCLKWLKSYAVMVQPHQCTRTTRPSKQFVIVILILSSPFIVHHDNALVLSSQSIIAVIYHHQQEHKMKIRNTNFLSGNFALQSGEQDGALTGIR